MSYDPEYCDHNRRVETDDVMGEYMTDDGYWEHDARGIPLAKVCDKCRKHKLAKYRPAVLTNPGYHPDDPIEP